MLSDKTALIVEDEASMRRFAASVLRQQLNCKNVIQAGTAEDALKILQSSQIVDLILSDWEMPGMKGDELLYNIRMDFRLGKTPFIMITGRSDKDALITAVQAGTSDYIIKPFSAATLIQKITKVLNMGDKRSMSRISAKSNVIEVNISFSMFSEYTAILYDISQTGCLVRTPLFKHGIKGVYEKAELTIKTPGQPITIQVEIARMEGDRDDPPSVMFMMAGFQFSEIDPLNANRLIKLIKALTENDTLFFAEKRKRTKDMMDL